MAELFTVASLAAFFALAAMEIVLGIDNVVFIAILSGKLPPDQQAKARNLGLGLAALGRIILLFCVTWVITLDQTTIFTFGEEKPAAAAQQDAAQADGGDTAADADADEDADAEEEEDEHAGPVRITVKDLILILGGLFLLAKGTWEIHHSIEASKLSGHDDEAGAGAATVSFGAVIAQILALDMVFSIDSVLTAVGMVEPSGYKSAPFPFTSIPWPPLVIMISAIVLAIVVMLAFSGPLSRFIARHPTMKMLALSFLLLIGLLLVVEGLHQHVPRGYVYFAMGFSLFVEILNLQIRKRGRKKQAAGA